MRKEIKLSGSLQLLGGGMFLIGVLLLAAAGWFYRQESANQKAWTVADGEVLRHEVVLRTGRAGTSSRSLAYSPRFQVRYVAGDVTFVSWVDPGYGTSRKSTVEALAGRFPDGARIQVRYNPSEPSELIFSNAYPDLAYAPARSLGTWAMALLAIGGFGLVTGRKMGARGEGEPAGSPGLGSPQ